MTRYIAAIDQGTTSTRCMLFDHAGQVVSSGQREHAQLFAQPGWVEHDALEIWGNTQAVIGEALRAANATATAIAAVGITNQRETTVVWDRESGQPYGHAIVWQDTRTDELIRALEVDGGPDRFRAMTGLPLATYFSGPKLRWILDNVAGVREAADAGRALFGTMDSWLIWQLTGGPKGGAHITDVTNASRTQLMNLHTLAWDEALCEAMGVPMQMLPAIRSSSEVYGHTTEDGPFGGRIPIAGDLGDQHAATVGQACFDPGDAKNTYGTGCFMLLNTGSEAVPSQHGLLTTLAYQLGDEPPTYALEGSIAVTGALVQWLRDNLQLIESAAEIEALAASVDDNGDVYFVPSFSGLFAPYWRSDARGVIVGLTRYAHRGHIARAALEASAYQTRDVLEAMEQDSGVALRELKVDGEMVRNELLMQFQADVLGAPVVRPKVTETTALGAAYAAGLAVGFWADRDELRANWQEGKRWLPDADSPARTRYYAQWKRAVTRSFDWKDEQ